MVGGVCEGGTERKWHCCWERGVGGEGMSNEVMVEVGRCIMCWLVKCWPRCKGLMYGLPTHTSTIAVQFFF